MKLTRREVVTPVILSPAMLKGQQTVATGDVELQAARERLKTNAHALNTVTLPMSIEPAFQFKA